MDTESKEPVDGAASRSSPPAATGPDGTRARPTRIVLVGAGSLNVSLLPWWVMWSRQNAPDVALRIIVTRSATRFVSRDALSVLSETSVSVDVWPESFDAAPHTRLARWADGFVVYPATAHYLTRLSLGLSDTPSLMAIACSHAPVVVAPALPAGLFTSRRMRTTLERLAEQDVEVLATHAPGFPERIGRDDPTIPPPFPDVLRRLRSRIDDARRGEAGSANG